MASRLVTGMTAISGLVWRWYATTKVPMRGGLVTVGIHRWTRNRWSATLSALALVMAATVPVAIASATAARASTPPPYQLTGGLPAGAKMLDTGGLTPRS